MSSSGSHMSRTSCSMWTCRALESRHTSHCRVVVSRRRCCLSKLRQVYTPLGQLITYVSSSTSYVHLLLGLFTSNSATFIRHFPHFACVFPRSASFLLFPSILSFLPVSYLASLSLIYNFLTFRRDLLRMKQHRYVINYFDPRKTSE